MQYTIKKVAKELKDLEKHPVFELAEIAPVYILNGRVYSKAYYEITEIDEFSNLDSIAQERNQFLIEKMKEKYAKYVRKKIANKEEKEMTIQQLVYTKVFPYLRENKYGNKLEDLINKDEKDTPNSAQKNKENDKSALKNLKKINKLIEKIESEQCEKITEENIAIIEGKIYKIKKEIEESDNADLSIGEKHYKLTKTLKTTKDLEEKYLMGLSKQIMLDVLKNEFSQEKIEQMLKKEDRMLKKITHRKRYEEGEYGFEEYDSDGYLYVYIKVPAFAVKSQFDDNYYFFKKTKIGLLVFDNEDEKLPYDEGFLLMVNNNHPFLNMFDYYDHEKFYEICTGRNSFPTTGKDIGDVIAKRLRKARDFLMYALSSSDKVERECYQLKKYCNECQTDHYRKNRISLEKLKKMKVPIISRDSFIKTDN